MKFLVQFSRVLVGLLFILSGLLKLNDPKGFSYKFDEYFYVFADDFSAKQDSVRIDLELNGKSGNYSRELVTKDSLLQVLLIPAQQQEISEDSTTSVSKIALIATAEGYEFHSDTLIITAAKTVKGRLIVRAGNTIIADKSISLDTGFHQSQSELIDVHSSVQQDSKFVDLFKWCRKHSMAFAIFMSWLEAILGFSILIGWQPRFTSLMLVLLTLFFTFLTWYSWVYDKVTDCGCFGEALPLDPRQSFFKNIILGVFILILFIGAKRIKPFFSNPFGVKVLTILTILLVSFSLYCKHYLPVVDFLQFKEGNDIHALTLPEHADKTGLPPIHDFHFYDDNGDDWIDTFWNKGDKKMLAVFYDLEEANPKSIEKLRALAEVCNQGNIPFYAITASSNTKADKFRHDHQISEFNFYYGDGTNLKSIIRSNPGLLLITDSTIVKKQWPSTHLPKPEKLQKMLE